MRTCCSHTITSYKVSSIYTITKCRIFNKLVMHQYQSMVLFLKFFWGRWVGDRSQGDLAKFGYMFKRKVDKFKNHAIFGQHARNLLHKNGEFNFFFLTMWPLWATSFPKKVILFVTLAFFLLPRLKNVPNIETLVPLYHMKNWYHCTTNNIWSSWCPKTSTLTSNQQQKRCI